MSEIKDKLVYELYANISVVSKGSADAIEIMEKLLNLESHDEKYVQLIMMNVELKKIQAKLSKMDKSFSDKFFNIVEMAKRQRRDK